MEREAARKRAAVAPGGRADWPTDTGAERALADANRQLLERDEEFARLLAERDAALERIQARAQAQVDALAHELEARAAKVEELDARLRSAYETIAAMEATRVWRLGQRLWATRDSLARALRFRRA